MKLIFFGTPDFAIPSLELLHKSNHDILAVITSTDKKSGRGLKMTLSPIKLLAKKYNYPIYQPTNFKDNDFIKELTNLKPDLFIVVAFKKLPTDIISIPLKGSINLHASLLPKYRGAAPIFHALLNNEKHTGVTTFFLNNNIDSGKILLQKTYKLNDTISAGLVHDDLALLGANLLIDTLSEIESESISPYSQNNNLSTFAPKITSQDCLIKWNNPSNNIYNQIRGLSPYPGAFTFLNNKRIKIYKAKKNHITNEVCLKSGQIRYLKPNLIVGTGSGLLSILELQIEGKSKMSIKDFISGYQNINGMRFE